MPGFGGGALGRATTGSRSKNQLATGESLFDRGITPLGESVAASSGQLVINYFEAEKTESINNIAVWTGQTAAAATPTLIRFGIYSVAADDSGVALLASTANDTTLLSVASTRYPKALTSTWSKVAGVRYAFTYLIVSGAALPTFIARNTASLAILDSMLATTPRICATLNAQADLPASWAVGSLANTRRHCYAEFTP